MPRHSIIRLLALSLLALLAQAGWSTHTAHAASSADYKIEVQYSTERLMRLQCNGDSVPLAVRITRVSDGSPVLGATVYISSNNMTTTTNRRGVAHGLIGPVTVASPSPTLPQGYVFVSADVDGVDVKYGLIGYSCPFPAGDYGLTVHLFIDRNRNGAMDRHETDFADKNVTLALGGAACCQFGGRLSPRIYSLDHDGIVSTTLPVGGFGVRVREWDVCLSERDASRGWQIITLNGSGPPPYAYPPYTCVGLPQLVPGSNNITIGVARTHPDGPE